MATPSNSIRYSLTINNEELSNLDVFRKPAVWMKDDNSYSLWFIYWDIPIGVLPKGRYIVEAKWFANETINNGIIVVPKGGANKSRLILNIVE